MQNRVKQIRIALVAAMSGVALLMLARSAEAGEAKDGLALAVVYDTSGSMQETVKSSAGTDTPKWIIANRSLAAMIRRLEMAQQGNGTGAPLRIEAGLVIFSGDRSKPAVPWGAFNPAEVRAWLQEFSKPTGSTPLGEALQMAGKMVLDSPMTRKHIVVLTDGENTRGVHPATVLPELIKKAEKAGTSVFVHFVAFDVNTKVFARLKEQGATLVGAANEKELQDQLDFILEEKILLEAEPPHRQNKN